MVHPGCMTARPPEVAPDAPAPRRHLAPWKWVLVIGSGLIALAIVVVFAVAFIVDVTAIEVRFVNDTGMVVVLPDCSTDLAQIDAHQSAMLPVASDHPSQCTVDDAYRGRIIGCVTMPHPIQTTTVIRLSDNHPCR